MRSHVTFLRHPLHPMLVMFPVALFPLLLILDVVAVNAPDAGGLWRAGFLTAAIAAVVTLLAIVPGFVDYAAIRRETPARQTATTHMVIGLATLALLAGSVYLRWPLGATPAATSALIAVDGLGTLAVFAQGWLGGHLVYRYHVGVDAPTEGGDPVPLEEGPGIHVPPPAPAVRRRPLR